MKVFFTSLYFSYIQDIRTVIMALHKHYLAIFFFFTDKHYKEKQPLFPTATIGMASLIVAIVPE